ncbi:Alpha-tubulin N-acetyltransferase 1 [Mortierella claussenii]|nr:Alpha-tubulin N-acetyltransferase 1 [Mortierella claussenii]
MDFDFPLIPLLPLPITLVPAATFAALEHNQNQIQQAFASSVSIGLTKNNVAISSNNSGGLSLSTSSSSSFSSSSVLSNCPSGLSTTTSTTLTDQERLGAIVDALGQASARAQELPTSITQTLRLAKNPTQRVYILRTGLESGEDQWLNQLEIGSPLMTESIRKSLWDLHGPTLSSGADEKGAEQDRSSAMSPQENMSKRSVKSRSEEKGVYVAGMLKIGEKKLFIVDKFGTMHEQEVCCVLDFYVEKSCQRRGFGKLLFDYMLKVEDIKPNQIAYDRPSPKLYRFLSKYFQLERHLPQPNMFAIFEGFKLQDCGETIQVDDDDLATLGRHHTNTSSAPIPSSVLADSNTCSFSGHYTSTSHSNGASTISKAASRALQSSVVFSSEHAHTAGTATAHTSVTMNSTQQQQHNRRVSSAFSSSISLSGPTISSYQGSGGAGSGLPPIATSSPATTASPLSPTHTRPQSGGSAAGGGGARISRLLASSIVFADPTVSCE